MKVYIEIGEAINEIVNWINSGEYKTMMNACNGETKEDGFRGACFIIPSILCAKCQLKYEK